MGTSKQQRKYNNKQIEEPSAVKYKILINNNYFLREEFETWEDAESFAKRFVRGKRMCYVIVTGV